MISVSVGAKEGEGDRVSIIEDAARDGTGPTPTLITGVNGTSESKGKSNGKSKGKDKGVNKYEK